MGALPVEFSSHGSIHTRGQTGNLRFTVLGPPRRRSDPSVTLQLVPGLGLRAEFSPNKRHVAPPDPNSRQNFASVQGPGVSRYPCASPKCEGTGPVKATNVVAWRNPEAVRGLSTIGQRT